MSTDVLPSSAWRGGGFAEHSSLKSMPPGRVVATDETHGVVTTGAAREVEAAEEGVSICC